MAEISSQVQSEGVKYRALQADLARTDIKSPAARPVGALAVPTLEAAYSALGLVRG